MNSFIDFGIDLGTTNSCIARFANDQVQIFQNADQMNVTPSAVRLEKSGRSIVGRRAYASRLASPENVSVEFKRWMGQTDTHFFPSANQRLSAEELSAKILQSLMEDVRSQTGAIVDSAVITVPAAFGHLQCESTANAARLAGLDCAILLQEPIAAAIAYGIKSESKDQRWLVFDLGGGTFDVAVMSSREGKLTVLDHRGNNHLGGKDIDGLIVQRLFLPILAQEYALPDREVDPRLFHRLSQRLLLKAEEVKLDLSRNSKVTVSIFDVGEDIEGKAIELEFEVSRGQLNSLCEPLVEKCLTLCAEAVAGSRAGLNSIDKVLLVGGPTQMPIVREALEERYGGKVDHSVDPMTIVAQGAAIHASTQEILSSKPSVVVSGDTQSKAVQLHLAYDSVSSERQVVVEGDVEITDYCLKEIKFDAENGSWTSGWINIRDGQFECSLLLTEGKTNRYQIFAKNDGQSVIVYPSEIHIRHGLTLSSPPLPHSLSTEVETPNGRTVLEPLLKKGSLLPNSISKTFRASKNLLPNSDDSLAIKVWEGENLKFPEANDMIGNLLIKGEDLNRAIPEGTEIEITLSIDESRLITVSAFVPRLNKHFSEEIFVPKWDYEDFKEVSISLSDSVEQNYERLRALENRVDSVDRKTMSDIDRVKEQLVEFDLELDNAKMAEGLYDPDKTKHLLSNARKLEFALQALENEAEDDGSSDEIMDAIRTVDELGTSKQQADLKYLLVEYDISKKNDDLRMMGKIRKKISDLRMEVVFAQDEMWVYLFEELPKLPSFYLDGNAAVDLFKQGKFAIDTDNNPELRRIVVALYQLLPPSEVEQVKNRAMRSGLRNA